MRELLKGYIFSSRRRFDGWWHMDMSRIVWTYQHNLPNSRSYYYD